MKEGITYNYLNRLYYDEFEQRVLLEAGNGVGSTYTYDPASRRLSDLVSTQPGDTPFQNLSYKYDVVGNITHRINDVPVLQPPLGGAKPGHLIGGPVVETYDYDSLYRLTHAEGSFDFAPAKTDKYTLDLQYDNIHNLTRKAQVSRRTVQDAGPGSHPRELKNTTYTWDYRYTGPQPHAPTLIGCRDYGYDANGNQTGYANRCSPNPRNTPYEGGRRIVWDEESRVMAIHDHG